MQATVAAFDATTGAGSVLLDDGAVLEFGRDAFRASGLRLLRPGQRVALRSGGCRRIEALNLVACQPA